jgi:ribosomal protein S12 methylthiotransferase
VPEDAKEERYQRIMALTARISAEKLAAKVGKQIEVIIDRVDDYPGEDGPDRAHFDAPHPEHHHGVGATGRSKADAPEIDGEVHLRDAGGLKAGDIVLATIEESDEHDLYGVPA